MKKFVRINRVLVPIISLLSLLFIFLPIMKETTQNGSIEYPSINVIFGLETVLNDGVNQFTYLFQINTYLLIALQLILLSSFILFFGRKNYRTLIFGTIFVYGGLILWIFFFNFITIINPGFNLSNVIIGICPLMMIIVLAINALLSTINCVYFLRQKVKNK